MNSLDIYGAKRPAPDAAQCLTAHVDVRSHPLKLVYHWVEVLRNDPLDGYVALSDGGAGRECTGNEAVRHHRVLAAVEALHPFNDQRVAAFTRDACPHALQEAG